MTTYLRLFHRQAKAEADLHAVLLTLSEINPRFDSSLQSTSVVTDQTVIQLVGLYSLRSQVASSYLSILLGLAFFLILQSRSHTRMVDYRTRRPRSA